MLRLKTIIRNILPLMLLACFSACQNEDADLNFEQGGEGSTYLILKISSGSDSRAVTPLGWEDGDGREVGHYHENDIKDFCFFIYNDEGKLFTEANSSTPIKYKRFVNNVNFEGVNEARNGVTYQTDPIRLTDYRPKEGDRIIIIANMGDVTPRYNTIDDLRKAQITKSETWTEASLIKEYTSFTMTSSTDNDEFGKVDINSHSGDITNPFLANAQVERVAARVDWILPQKNGAPNVTNNGAEYTVTDDSNNTIGTMYLTDVRMINENLMPTYLIRRTAETTSADAPMTYMGKVDYVSEQVQVPNCYVIEPLTQHKHIPFTYNVEEANTWYLTPFSDFKQNNASLFPTGNSSFKVAINASNENYFQVNGKDWCYTVGYEMENIAQSSTTDEDNYRFATAVGIKCVFIPQQIYSYDLVNRRVELMEEGNYTYGRNIYSLQCPEHPEHNYFFDSKNDRASFRYDHPCEKCNTYDYENGVCYYYIPLKHAAANGAQRGTYPMEYAIVRNNIYRIEIVKIRNIGTVVPDPTVVDRIKVREWNRRDQPVIRL